MIAEDGSHLGVMKTADALKIAVEKGMDLVEVGADNKPPTCRIMDYGRFKYQKEKKSKEGKKNRKVIHIKEIKMGPKIGVHDIDFKIRHIEEFLKGGDKVKITVRFRGRQMQHVNLGRELLDRVVEKLGEKVVVEQPQVLDHRNLSVLVAPK